MEEILLALRVCISVFGCLYSKVYMFVCVDICLCVCTFAHGFVNVFSYMVYFCIILRACARGAVCTVSIHREDLRTLRKRGAEG